MTEEIRDMPAITLTALALLQNEIARQINAISQQTLDVLGLEAADGWRIDVSTGKVLRTVPDVKPDVPGD